MRTKNPRQGNSGPRGTVRDDRMHGAHERDRDTSAENYPSTGFIVLAVSIVLILCGLLATGAVNPRDWF